MAGSRRKANQVYDQYVANPKFRPLMQDYLGKPLLVVYVNTPSPFQGGVPDWNDERFTVRWMTGFLTQQKKLVTEDLISRYGYWSWEDRGTKPTASSMRSPRQWLYSPTGAGSTRELPPPAAAMARPFATSRHRARKIGPRFAMLVSWNEWHLGEQPSAEISKDVEPSKEFGHQYLDIMKEQIAEFKAGR